MPVHHSARSQQVLVITPGDQQSESERSCPIGSPTKTFHITTWNVPHNIFFEFLNRQALNPGGWQTQSEQESTNARARAW